MSAPPPVPALPDSARVTSYAITSQTGPFDVGFQIYGDGSDYANWVQVFLGDVQLTAVAEWTLALTSGTLPTVARPIQNARITLTSPRTGTLTIIGARRPRRLQEFAENEGVTARDLNVVLNDIVAQNREAWDNLVFGGGTGGGGGFIQLGAGAVTRTMLDKAREVFSIKDFGGAGDGITDNSAALSAAFAALTVNGGSIYFPAGKYRFNTGVTLSMPPGVFSVSLIGQGQENTILYWSNASGGITLNYNGPSSSSHVSDLTFTTGAEGTVSGTALKLVGNVTTPNPTQSDVSRVTMRGDPAPGYLGPACWAAGLMIVDVSSVNVEGLTVAGDASLVKGIGIDMTGSVALSAYAVALNISKSFFSGLNIGLLYDSWAQGVTVSQTNFGDCQLGILANASAVGPFGLDQLIITDCAFNNGVSSISLQTSVNNVFISNSYFITQFNNQICVNLINIGFFSITNNSFNGTAGTNTTAIAVGTNTGQGVISGNIIRGYTNAGIVLQAPSTVVFVESNTISASAIPISNLSVANTNKIINNPGYNPVGNGGNITVGASPFTYTSGASPEVIYIRTGGLVDLVTLFGLAIAANVGANVPITVALGPRESFTITYSVATPTLAKNIK